MVGISLGIARGRHDLGHVVHRMGVTWVHVSAELAPGPIRILGRPRHVVAPVPVLEGTVGAPHRQEAGQRKVPPVQDRVGYAHHDLGLTLGLVNSELPDLLRLEGGVERHREDRMHDLSVHISLFSHATALACGLSSTLRSSFGCEGGSVVCGLLPEPRLRHPHIGIAAQLLLHRLRRVRQRLQV